MDEKAKRTALRMINYGLYVLGVEHEGAMAGCSVTWVTQCSFEPPLLALGVKKESHVYGLLKGGRRLALSYLESGQDDLARAFFKAPRAENGRLAGYCYSLQATGAPVLDDAMAFVEAEVVSIDESGDHAVVVARVVNAAVRREGVPLSCREMGVSYGG